MSMPADRSSRATPVAPADWKRMLQEAQMVSPAQPPATAANTSRLPGCSGKPLQGSAKSASYDVTPASSSACGGLARKPVVLDVRNAYEWDAGHFAGAQRPVEDAFNETPRKAGNGGAALPDALKGAAPETPVMVCCLHHSSCYQFCLRLRCCARLLKGGAQVLEHACR